MPSTSVQTVEHVALSDYRFGNQGAEPAVIGVALAQNQGEVSAPIKGNAGVYVVKTTAKTVAPAEFDAKAEEAQLVQRYSYLLLDLRHLLSGQARIVGDHPFLPHFERHGLAVVARETVFEVVDAFLVSEDQPAVPVFDLGPLVGAVVGEEDPFFLLGGEALAVD